MNFQDITLQMTWPFNHFRCYIKNFKKSFILQILIPIEIILKNKVLTNILF